MTAPNNSQIPFTPPACEPQMSDLLDLLKKEIFRDLNCHHLATIQSFDPTTQTATATINYTKTFFKLNAGTQVVAPVQVSYPLLIDMPVVVLGGGGFNVTFPIAQGDQCLILFNDRSIDNWFQSGQTGPLSSPRTHSFSDGICLVGLNFLTGTGGSTALTNYDTTRAMLRNKAGVAGVGVGASKIKIFNSGTTLNTLLQSLCTNIGNLCTALEALTVLCATPGSPSGPPVNIAAITSVGTAISSLGTQIGALLE